MPGATDFNQLPPDEQTALFTDAAQEALTAWRIPQVALELLSLRSNAVFSAIYPEHPDERRMILRVNWPARKSLQTIRSEGVWLDVLSYHKLPVPRLIRAVTPVNISRSAQTFACSLFEYQAGEMLAVPDYTPAHAAQIGACAAQLHSVNLKMPEGGAFSRPVLDAEGILGSRSPHFSGEAGEALLAPLRPVLDTVRARLEGVFSRLEAAGSGFGLIHGDLKPDNLLFDGDSLRVLDFDDCAWGYYLYDLAPLLLFIRLGLRAAEKDAAYPALKAALWQGYTAVRPQPDAFFDDLETLAMGRYSASCLWVAAHRDHPAYRGKVEGILAARIAEISALL